MIRRRRLGQHFLRSARVAEEMASAARITGSDTVFELGTGLGMLTPLLCRDAARVVSVEADRALAEEAASSLGHLENLELRAGDALEMDEPFTVFVSSVPYSRSRDVVEWLAQRDFERGVVLVQEEFADKLMAKGGGRRAVSVVAGHAFGMSRVAPVGRGSFDPPPRVDSVIVRLEGRNVMGAGQIRVINRMFSYRKKTVGNVLAQFGIRSDSRRRLDDMTGGEIVGLADEILR